MYFIRLAIGMMLGSVGLRELLRWIAVPAIVEPWHVVAACVLCIAGYGIVCATRWCDAAGILVTVLALLPMVRQLALQYFVLRISDVLALILLALWLAGIVALTLQCADSREAYRRRLRLAHGQRIIGFVVGALALAELTNAAHILSLTSCQQREIEGLVGTALFWYCTAVYWLLVFVAHMLILAAEYIRRRARYVYLSCLALYLAIMAAYLALASHRTSTRVADISSIFFVSLAYVTGVIGFWWCEPEGAPGTGAERHAP